MAVHDSEHHSPEVIADSDERKDEVSTKEQCVYEYTRITLTEASGVCKSMYELTRDHCPLEKDQWFKVGQKGSHVQFKHPLKKGRVTVPHPKKDVPIGTLRSIENRAQIKLS